MCTAQQHKDRAADLQRQLDEAKTGADFSTDRAKLMVQM